MSLWKTISGSIASQVYAKNLERKFEKLSNEGVTQVDGRPLSHALQEEMIRHADLGRDMWPAASTAIYKEVTRQQKFRQQTMQLGNFGNPGYGNGQIKSLEEFDQKSQMLLQSYRKLPAGANMMLQEQRDYLSRIGIPQTAQEINQQIFNNAPSQSYQDGEYLIAPEGESVELGEDYLVQQDDQSVELGKDYLVQESAPTNGPALMEGTLDAVAGVHTLSVDENSNLDLGEGYLIQQEANTVDLNNDSLASLQNEVNSDLDQLQHQTKEHQSPENELGQLMLLADSEYLISPDVEEIELER